MINNHEYLLVWKLTNKEAIKVSFQFSTTYHEMNTHDVVEFFDELNSILLINFIGMELWVRMNNEKFNDISKRIYRYLATLYTSKFISHVPIKIDPVSVNVSLVIPEIDDRMITGSQLKLFDAETLEVIRTLAYLSIDELQDKLKKDE